MIYHVLPGDAQVEEFRKTGLDGELIICREAFVVGPIGSKEINEFWDERARFVLSEYGEDAIAYHEKVADELLRLGEATAGDEVNLWFEYELFCSVNLWFCLEQLKGSGAEIFRVAPSNATPDDVWKGFGTYSADDLSACFELRIPFSEGDAEIGSRLWNAFAHRDPEELRSLGEYRSPCFPFLKEVCEAAAEVDKRPAAIVSELKAEGRDDIESIFPEFQKRAGVFGFGDLQVQKLIDTV